MMKTYLKKRIERRQFHQENVQLMPPETHRITGWDELVKYLGWQKEKINRWMKLEGFPKPVHHYRQKSDHSGNRPGDPLVRQNVWRRVSVWDKRDIGDWLARR